MIMLFAAANRGRSPWRKAAVNGIPVGADLEYADEVTMLKAWKAAGNCREMTNRFLALARMR